MLGCCVYFYENVLVLSPGMFDPRQFVSNICLHENVLVLSPGMLDPRQFLSNMYLHQNVLVLSSGMFNPRQFVLVFLSPEILNLQQIFCLICDLYNMNDFFFTILKCGDLEFSD